ncbi:MAG: hypothetical protein ACRDFX_12785, partial [Chloroflexota bacterium]
MEPRSLRSAGDTDYLPTHSGGILTTRVQDVAHWAQSNSMWPALFGLACCAIEMMAMSAPRWDLA